MSVEEIVGHLGSADNAIRRQAEELLTNAMQNNICELVTQLVRIIETPESPISQQAVLQLRRCIRGTSFASFPSAAKLELLNKLFGLHSSIKEATYKNLSSVVASLIYDINENSELEDVPSMTIATKISSFVQSANPIDQLWGLQLFSDLFEFIKEIVKGQVEQFCQIVVNFLSNHNGNKRILLAALQCASSILEYCVAARKNNLFPTMLQAVCANPEESTVDVFVNMIYLDAKIVPKNLVESFVNGFISVAKNSNVAFELRSTYIQAITSYINNRQALCAQLGINERFIRSLIEIVFESGIPDEDLMSAAFPHGAHVDVEEDLLEFHEDLMHTLDSLCNDIDNALYACKTAVTLANTNTPNAIFAALTTIMACADHFSDDVEANIDEAVASIIHVLQTCIVHSDWRIVLVAFRALTICSNGSTKFFTIEHHKYFLEKIRDLLIHPKLEVRAYAVRSCYDYGELVDSELMKTVSADVSKRIFAIFTAPNCPPRIMARCFTALSVICLKDPSVLTNEYDQLMNLAVDYALAEGPCQPRALEHVTRLAVTYGKERFLATRGLEVLKILPGLRMKVTTSQQVLAEGDDDLRSYVDDALSCFIELLGEAFVDVFEMLVPVILKAIECAAPIEVDSVDDTEQITVVDRAANDEKFLAVRNEAIEDLNAILEIAASAVEKIGVAAHARGGNNVESKLFELAVYKYDENVRIHAVFALAKFVAARFQYINNPETANKISPDVLQQHLTELRGLSVNIIKKLIENLEASRKEIRDEMGPADDEEGDEEDVRAQLRDEAELTFRCLHMILKCGIKNVLPNDVITKLLDVVMHEIDEHFSRTEMLEKKKESLKNTEDETDDLQEIEDEEGREVSTRTIINDVLTAIIESHPQDGVNICGSRFISIIQNFLQQKQVIFQEAAMCFASDWIEFADKHVPVNQRLTPSLIQSFISSNTLCNDCGSIRQPTSFAIQKAFQHGLVQGADVDIALTGLFAAMEKGDKLVATKKKDAKLIEQAALDNTVAAIFEAVLSLTTGVVQPTAKLNNETAPQILTQVFKRLPLKTDHEENNCLLNKILQLVSGPHGQAFFGAYGVQISTFVGLSLDNDMENELKDRTIKIFKDLMAQPNTKPLVVQGVMACPARVQSKLSHFLK
eukprot:GDKK01010176.1.p1 GENE.GDKK01010176.1~~GDKK01010176.1.p1  ORF type:complete len:1149 (+),score=461.91 GDKK01010176.1:24-3449(+)